MAQLDRASACGAGDYRFESCRGHMINKPKILIFSLAYDPLWGGAEIAVKNITDRLTDISFDMLTLKFDQNSLSEERIGNINVHRINSSKLLFSFKAYYKAKKLHKEKEYDITMAVMAFYAGLSALFFKWKYPQVKYVLNMQSGDSDLFIWLRTWFWRPLYKKIYQAPNYIYAISHFLINRAKKYGYKGPIELVPNGVNVKNYKSQITNHKLHKKETVLITTSRLVQKNGIEDLINATKILNDKGYKIKTLILGTGYLEENLKLKIKNLKLQDKVLLLGDVSQEEIPKYLKSADIFIRPSLSEGLGISFLEAMAVGLPIIGTPVGGIPDFLVDPSTSSRKATGLFCEVNNPKSIAEKVELLLKDDNLKKQLISNAQNLISEKYDWDIIAQKMQVIFFKLNG